RVHLRTAVGDAARHDAVRLCGRGASPRGRGHRDPHDRRPGRGARPPERPHGDGAPPWPHQVRPPRRQGDQRPHPRGREQDEGAEAPRRHHVGGPPARPLMRVLIVTREFPNAQAPHFATFNRQQFAALGRRCQVDVLASIPWFPGASLFSRWSNAGRLTGVPREETIDGLPVAHPRCLYVPKIARGAGGALYAASLAAEAWRRRGRYDVVLGSWAFPDGVGAVALAMLVGAPAVVKVHGTDMNVVAKM